ncbi:hypothetical protein B0H17DRAFT_1133956 [Mycena rosella]|uniref:Uncharacterized protein n=1 Tax=Mycena rosella TaxID=1033263 RepID=A0AAD7DH18_MYCRO|nr:hypothetical protein B0H17DRAFT_1133956 [Mycena rosella]
MLASSPQLSTLILGHVTRPPVPDQYDTVTLTALTSIPLRDHVIVCAALLNHLRFPLTTRVHIYPAGVRIGADIRELLVPIHQRLYSPAALKVALLLIEWYGSSDPGHISHFLVSIYENTLPPDPLKRDPTITKTVKNR